MVENSPSLILGSILGLLVAEFIPSVGNVGRYLDRLISLPRDVRPVDTHVTVVSMGWHNFAFLSCAELWQLSSFTLHHCKIFPP
jgi:hypothetical protein